MPIGGNDFHSLHSASSVVKPLLIEKAQANEQENQF